MRGVLEHRLRAEVQLGQQHGAIIWGSPRGSGTQPEHAMTPRLPAWSPGARPALASAHSPAQNFQIGAPLLPKPRDPAGPPDRRVLARRARPAPVAERDLSWV